MTPGGSLRIAAGVIGAIAAVVGILLVVLAVYMGIAYAAYASVDAFLDGERLKACIVGGVALLSFEAFNGLARRIVNG